MEKLPSFPRQKLEAQPYPFSFYGSESFPSLFPTGLVSQWPPKKPFSILKRGDISLDLVRPPLLTLYWGGFFLDRRMLGV